MTTLGNKKRGKSAWSKRIAVLAGALFIGGAGLGGPPSLTLGEVGNVSSVLDGDTLYFCLLYTSPSPRDKRQSRMPSSA